MERRLDEDAELIRVSERDYLVAQPSRERAAARALCLRSLREILVHFLGKSSTGQLKIYEVSEVSRGGILAAPVDPRLILQARPEEPAEARSWRPRDEAAWAPAMPLRPSTLFTPLSDGVAVSVEPSIEPIFCLKTGRYIGQRIVRCVRNGRHGLVMADRDLERLARCDVERIDLATIALGLDQIERANRPRDLALMVPVSFTNLASHRGASRWPGRWNGRAATPSRASCAKCSISTARRSPPSWKAWRWSGAPASSPSPASPTRSPLSWARCGRSASTASALRRPVVPDRRPVRPMVQAGAAGGAAHRPLGHGPRRRQRAAASDRRREWRATHAGVPEDLRRALAGGLEGRDLDG